MIRFLVLCLALLLTGCEPCAVNIGGHCSGHNDDPQEEISQPNQQQPMQYYRQRTRG